MPYAHKEDKAAQMRNYRERQTEENARRDAQLRGVRDLFDGFINARMAEGLTREQAIDQFVQDTTPPETEVHQEEELKAVGTAIDSAVPSCTAHLGRSCPNFGKEFHKDSDPCQRTCTVKDDCHRAWVNELFKPQAVKDSERRQIIIDVLNSGKALAEKIERRERAELDAKIQAAEDARQKEFDVCVKKYVARGDTEEAATELATLEMKQKRNAELAKEREFRRDWERMTEEERTARKMKIREDNKKLLGGSE